MLNVYFMLFREFCSNTQRQSSLSTNVKHLIRGVTQVIGVFELFSLISDLSDCVTLGYDRQTFSLTEHSLSEHFWRNMSLRCFMCLTRF